MPQPASKHALLLRLWAAFMAAAFRGTLLGLPGRHHRRLAAGSAAVITGHSPGCWSLGGPSSTRDSERAPTSKITRCSARQILRALRGKLAVQHPGGLADLYRYPSGS